MNTQKKIMFLVCSLWGADCMAHSQTLKIDMGSIQIKAVDASSKEDISYVMPPQCPGATLNIQHVDGLVSIMHQGKRCESGAKITIPIRINVDTEINLGAGTIEISDSRGALNKLSEIRLSVKAGLIHSSTVPTSRTNNYAGQKGTLHRKSGNGHVLIANVNAGTITF